MDGNIIKRGTLPMLSLLGLERNSEYPNTINENIKIERVEGGNKMTPKEVSVALRRVQERYKNEITPTFEIRISDMAREAADAIDDLLALVDAKNMIVLHKGQTVATMIPNEDLLQIVVNDITVFSNENFEHSTDNYDIILKGEMRNE